MGKEEFKNFVKNKPESIDYIEDNTMTWQKFYEMYDLYGENDSVWDSYIVKEIKEEVKTTSNVGLNDIVSWFKNVDLDKMQESIGSVQRVLGVLGDLGATSKTETKPAYKPRPLYKHFED